MSILAPKQILDLPLEPNDSGATTVRGYLIELLTELWREESGFSGKRPFGQSGWQSTIELALVKAGVVQGTLDEDGYLDTLDDAAAQAVMLEAIRELGCPA